MNSDFLENDDLRMFEELLKRDAPTGRCDFDRVEDSLFKNIQGAEDDGALSVLKLDEILPETALERIECGLAKRIEQHLEYEMPVDECIKSGRDVHSRYWGFVENKLNKKIEEASLAPHWEQALKADEILSMGQWEAIEYALTEDVIAIGSMPPWEQSLMAEETALRGQLEKAEAGLTEKLNSVRKIPQWELVLLREEIASSGLLERAEQGLFLKINDYLSANSMVRASFRTYFAAVFGRLVNYRAIGIAIIAGLSLFGGYRAYRDNFQLIPIALYQVQGARQDLFNSPLPPKGLIQSEKGGGLTFVSKKGYVELQNGSQVEIKSASEKKVEYRAAFADVDNQLIGQGSATFFVNHQKKGQRYIVSTRDYRVEVTGTYFRLQPDIGEHVSVAVREGSLNIVFNNGEIKRLKAGQILAYDLNSNSYATSSDGMVIARQDIEQLPDIKDLNFYRQLSISTTPSAGIRIDGRFAGMSPLIIMQPKGVHSISIERSGYQTVDTSVTMGAGVAGAISLTLSPITDTTSLRQNVIVYEEVHVVNHVKPRQNLAAQAPVVSPAPQANAPKPEESPAYGDNDFRDAERLESGNWEKAIELYRAITENPLASRLQREAALFSIGKMKAEHEPVKTEAKEAFLNYLALYPTGNFVGESWLRLAELEFGNNQDKAIEYYQRYFEHFPGHSRVSELQHRVGLIYLQKKKYDEAIAMFKLSLANYQMDNIIDKGKIQSSLYRALKEKDDSQKTLPAAADVEQALKTR